MKKKTILIFVGESGSGKSTLERNLVNNFSDKFHKAISLTTRQPRIGEINGKDYWFIKKSVFEEHKDRGKLIQSTFYNDVHYGSLFADYITNHPYAILVAVPYSIVDSIPIFYKKLSHFYSSIEFRIVHFDISDKMLYNNMLTRGDSMEKAKQRLNNNTIRNDIKKYGVVADHTIQDDDLNEDLCEKFCQWLDIETNNENLKKFGEL